MAVKDSVLRLFTRLARLGAEPGESDELRAKRAVLMPTTIIVIGVLVGWIVVSAWLGSVPLMVFFVIVSSFLAGCMALAATRRLSYRGAALAVITVALIGPMMVMIMLGGTSRGLDAYLWSILAPLGALILLDAAAALGFFAAYVALTVIGAALSRWITPVVVIPPELAPIIQGSNIILASSIVFMVLLYTFRQREIALGMLREEQAKSEGLLLNILPQEIAAILKAENRAIAEQFEGASILFADVVDFTPLSSRLTAGQIVGLLNDVFSRFDALVEAYGLEKIKTIGDCYMVAAGVPHPRSDHAEALVRLALDMQSEVRTHTYGDGYPLTFRIGLSSGPVVAGVIGRKKFIYDLWGDAVNTASRMESHGAGGAIQITRETYELVKDKFVCEPRGMVTVKGKGAMEVWHVVGVKEEVVEGVMRDA